jgi:hypothetical protein
MPVPMIVIDPPVDDVPGASAIAPTTPATGLVRVAAARFCFAAASWAFSASIEAWSAASWLALAGWPVEPPAAAPPLVPPDPPVPPAVPPPAPVLPPDAPELAPDPPDPVDPVAPLGAPVPPDPL